MFLDNKYTKWYNNIIDKRKKELLKGYVEKHHIIPKSLGGSNEKENLVSLSAREHYIAHLLLTKMVEGENKSKMCWALHRMVFSSQKQSFSSYQYEMLRKIHSKNLMENHPSKKNSWRISVSKAVYSHWEENKKRKQKMSEMVKKRWRDDPDAARKIAIQNLPEPMIGEKNGMVKRIEYNGEYYWGWRELLEKTGCTKHLYNKYYKKGENPLKRKGCNGPIKGKESR